MADDNRIWLWYYGISEEGTFSGGFASKDEAIIEGRGDLGDDRGFYVMEATNPPLMLSDWVETGEIIMRANDSAFDNDRASSEWDDVVFEATKEQEADLAARIKAACDEWQAAHGLTFKVSTFEVTRNGEFFLAEGEPAT